MNKRQAAAVTAASVAGTAAASHLLTAYLVKMAVDRQAPGAVGSLARTAIRGSGCSLRFLQEMERSAKALRTRPHRRITIKGRDGAVLVGHYFPSPHPKRLVLGMHGWRSSWHSDFGMIAPFLLEEDCSLLLPEQRGQGASGGAYMGLGVLERHDCVRWAHYLAQENPHLPLYLAGISMGAATVLMSAELTLPGSVRGIVADCGFTSPRDICRHVVNSNLHLSYTVRSAAADRLCKRKNQAGLNGCSAPSALAKSKIPVLFIHGTDDSFVPVRMTFENYKACAGPKYMHIVPGADHGMSYYKDRAGYEQAVKNFWKRYD